MNPVAEVEKARANRNEQLLFERIDEQLDILFSAKDVGPEARRKLRHLLSYYAKKPHPFRACVRDNMKRFGPGRVERVCATLKDIIRNTTKWRKGRQSFNASDIPPELDEETEALLLSIPDEKLERLILEVQDV